ncbi:MAG: dephospho-CoA kinase [Prolixibacteraceae bacterium]|nr:dephospho-CoA kinase [Prolixibacteraceae bacterium]
MALKVGITGGIGSGKTTICRVFQLLGIPVFEADNVAKELLNSNREIKKSLIRLFGKDIYNSYGEINRKMLASIIFNDDIQLNKVNNLIHPAVKQEFSKWLEMQNTPYVIHEAAILFESGFYKMMDFTILVSAPEEERLARVMKRDDISAKLVKERMARQWPEEKKRELATVEICNDNTNLLIPEIIKTDKRLREYGKIW